ncbi:midnolin isoform X2 [Oryzias melastigma]|uniref:midnolin isoform X2 n=1 Tax=Oryzias melastigma TaxID=30732 RepID=UPI000CF8040B|nr:midnolin isoform X2 [Oryzias melastigma]
MDQHPSAQSCTSRGASSCESILTEPSMNLYIHSTTGTRFELSLPQEETVEGLKKRLSQRLKVAKDKLAVLHKETRLSSGKLQDLGISDGSKLTLVPTVEAGLMSQASRPEQSVMQALESLTEIQLQLAAQQSGGSQLHNRHLITRGGTEATMGQPTGQPRVPHIHPQSHPHHPHNKPSPLLSRPHCVPSSPSHRGPPSSPQPSTQQQPVPSMYHHSPSSAPSSTPISSPNPSCSSHTPGSFFRSSAHCHHHHNHHHQHHHHYHQLASTLPSQDLGQANCSTNGSNAGTCISQHSRKPGAIIESFVNHAPGVFSGTFSGTLHPNCQDSNGRPRRDIGTILQILNDLLSATRHYQGMPPSFTQLRYQTQFGPSSSPSPSPPPSPPAAGATGLSHKVTSVPAGNPSSPPLTLHPLVQCQSQIHMCKPGDRIRQTENRATRCKVERLQLLMQQKRLRRKARRDQRSPYQWLPNRRSGRSNSNSSMSSEGSLDLDFDDSVWKHDVKADLNSEYVMA